ncbi:unnamed protein product [marine sediment metagenome]|uniref:Uncharacterized protein n=1 Tax=marine sediment metagenome TaxID=412755 RepID=X1S4H9_9ZZZZ
MNHTQYMKRLDEFCDKLQAAGNARPYDPDKYNQIVDELNAIHQARRVELHSSAVLRFIKWAGKRGSAAAARLRKILKEGVTP